MKRKKHDNKKRKKKSRRRVGSVAVDAQSNQYSLSAGKVYPVECITTTHSGGRRKSFQTVPKTQKALLVTLNTGFQKGTGANIVVVYSYHPPPVHTNQK